MQFDSGFIGTQQGRQMVWAVSIYWNIVRDLLERNKKRKRSDAAI